MNTSLAEAIFGMRAADPALDERYWPPLEPNSVSAAGVRIGPDSAMRVSAVYRCVSILANSAALLPGGVRRRLETGREEMVDHPVWRLLWKRPNPYQTPFEFKRVMMAWAILRGTAFSAIYSRGAELELWPLHPDRMRGPELMSDGSRRYRYRRPDTNAEDVYIAGRDLLVVNGLSLDGLRGLAMADLARDSIGLAAATEQYGGQLFARGARFSGGLKLPAGKTIADPRARKALSDSIRKVGAGPGHWWGVPVFEDGMEWQSISMSNDDAQFLETRKFTITDIARWFGVPPHMIGDVERSTSWGSGIEQQSIGFITYGLMPWLALFEQAFEGALISAPDEYLRFDVAGLLRADVKTRFDVYDIAIRNGIYSPNDCRRLEDENPRAGGDSYVTPTAPQESPRDQGPEPPPVEPEPDDAAALASRVVAIAARLAGPPPDPRTEALEAVRAGAEVLGVPREAVRKLIASAKPKEKSNA